MKLTTNAKPALEAIELIDRRLAYIVSDALTDTAFQVRKEAFQEEFRQSFTLRNRFLLKGLAPGSVGPGGVGVQKSRPKVLMSRVFTGHGAEFTGLQESGGTKRRRAKPYAIPDPKSPDMNAKGFVRKKWPGRLRVGVPGSRVFQSGSRIVRRTKGTRQLTTLFYLRKRIKVRNRLDIRGRSQAIAFLRFPVNFENRWAKEQKRAGF